MSRVKWTEVGGSPSLWLVTGQMFFAAWISVPVFTACQLVSHGRVVTEREGEQEARGETAPAPVSHALSLRHVLPVRG